MYYVVLLATHYYSGRQQATSPLADVGVLFLGAESERNKFFPLFLFLVTRNNGGSNNNEQEEVMKDEEANKQPAGLLFVADC
jgi:hypothetical protein